MSRHRKSESGAQLLARLQTRPDLTKLDVHIFGSQESIAGQLSSASHQGKIIELYGREGVGKTELALYFIARTCLPSEWKGHPLPGLGANAMIIDTEWKFSVLRLAVILERLLVRAMEEISSKESNDNLLLSCQLKALNTKMCESDSRGENTNEGLTMNPEELDEIVQESLGRVQVLKVTSSLQLISSLMSLENTLSCDSSLTLIVIDSVSSFFWSDRAAEPDNISGTETKMKHVVKIIKKYSIDFGLTFLMTKFAFFGGKQKRDYLEEDTKQRESLEMTMDYAEFLGKSWSTLPTKRIFLEKLEPNQRDVCDYKAVCESWQSERKFVIKDDLLTFV